MQLEDKKLICKDCHQEFVWSVGEQKFFADKGFTNQPIRCSDCRKKKKGSSPTDDSHRSDDKVYQISCKACQKVSSIPFKPQNPDSLLCSECFEKTLADK